MSQSFNDSIPATSKKSVALLEANPNRKMATFFNESKSTLYINIGSEANASDRWSVKVGPEGYYELPKMDNDRPTDEAIYGIWTGDEGTCQVTETT